MRARQAAQIEARRVSARPHRVLELGERDFFELEIRRRAVDPRSRPWRNGMRHGRDSERGGTELKKRAAVESVCHTVAPGGNKGIVS